MIKKYKAQISRMGLTAKLKKRYPHLDYDNEFMAVAKLDDFIRKNGGKP